MSGRRKHDQFFPARESDRLTCHSYAAALGFALALLGLAALAI